MECGSSPNEKTAVSLDGRRLFPAIQDVAIWNTNDCPTPPKKWGGVSFPGVLFGTIGKDTIARSRKK